MVWRSRKAQLVVAFFLFCDKFEVYLQRQDHVLVLLSPVYCEVSQGWFYYCLTNDRAVGSGAVYSIS
jgi:hypothetical protein